MKVVVIKFACADTNFCERICRAAERLAYEIQGIVSLDVEEKLTSICDYPVFPLKDIGKLSWDVAILDCAPEIYNEFVPQLVDLKIGAAEQFKHWSWLIKQTMIAKYEDCADPVIQETLEYWKTNELSVFNQHIDLNRGTYDKIFMDGDLPYIYFKTIGGDYRKMYIPAEWGLITTYEGEKVVKDLMQEQLPTSPHLYTKGEHRVHEGDVLIDAGVAEGNFALKYVDICSKIYLFEPEPVWIKLLERTFSDYRDKVEIIPCFVSDITEHNVTRIDDAIPDLRGKNVFLKMDVEGSEPDALRGAKNLLTNNRVRASVCTYHNSDDRIKVKNIFRQYGYQTSTSNGYMVFICDLNILETADFRKGIVYATNF